MENTHQSKKLSFDEMEQVSGGASVPFERRTYAEAKESEIVWQVADSKTGALIKSFESDF